MPAGSAYYEDINAICFITSNCVACQHVAGQPRPQIKGLLPADRCSPGFILDCIEVDYVGPICTRSGLTSRSIFTKVYITLVVLLSVKAVHLEPVTELTPAAFIGTTCICHFIAQRGKPSVIHSYHGTNFAGSSR